jgi:hypothetical protein
LKRRIRARQLRAGERYTTARDAILAGAGIIPVEELDDLSGEAFTLGLKCKVFAFPRLRPVAREALRRIRDFLIETTGASRLRATALEGRVSVAEWRVLQLPGLSQLKPIEQFVERARAGLGGLSEGGSMIAVQIGDVPVVGIAWATVLVLA